MAKHKYKNKRAAQETAAQQAESIASGYKMADETQRAEAVDDSIYGTRPDVERPETRDFLGMEHMNFSDFALAEDELYEAEVAAGVHKKSWWVKLGDKWFDYKANRPRHLVNRKKYLWLTVLLGWCGAHRFYEKRWKLGLFYLALSWTGFPIALCVTDWMIAFPIKADEDGNILI